MLPRKIFETLDAEMAILVLFKQLILWQILFKFFAHNSESFIKCGSLHVYFVRTFSIYACLRCKERISGVGLPRNTRSHGGAHT